MQLIASLSMYASDFCQMKDAGRIGKAVHSSMLEKEQ